MERSSTERFEPVVTRSGPASVERQLVLADGDVVAEFTLTVTSDASQAVDVVDRLPGNWAVDEVRFAADLGPRSGTARADEVSFEALVEPGQGTIVVYRAVLQGSVEPCSIAAANELDPPHIEAVEPVSSGDDGSTGADSEREPDGPGRIEDPSVLFERTGEDPAVAPPRPGDPTGWVPDAESRSATGYTVARESRPVGERLLEELEAGTLSAAQLTALRERLHPATTERTAARLRRIESRLATVTDAVDENEVSLRALTERTAVLEAEHGELAAARTDIEGTIEELSAAVAEVESSMDTLRDRIAECERVRDGLVSALESRGE